MESKSRQRLNSLLRSASRYQRYVAVLACLALIVATSVTYMLMQRANAMSHKETILDCQFDGVAAHTHDASCYDADGNLVCPLPERELHTHDDSCYAEERVLACGLVEGADHEHTDECYETVRTLVCGLDEITETHVHGAGCFETVTVDDGDDDAATTDAGSTSAHVKRCSGAGFDVCGDPSCPDVPAPVQRCRRQPCPEGRGRGS